MTYGSAKRLVLELIAIYGVVAVPIVNAGVLSLFNREAAAAPTETAFEENQSAQFVPLLRAATHSDPNPAKGGGDIIVEDGALVPAGAALSDQKSTAKSNNGEISLYTVREGDTLSQIAEMFDVSAKTILWANNLSSANNIHPGDELVILPITGVRHVVKKGDTLQTIAKKYDGDVDDIIAYNQLSSASDISVGETLVVPNGVISTPTPAPVLASHPTSQARGVSTGNGSSGFINPVPGSVKTQGIHGYNGVDLAAPIGTHIRAAAGGTVIVAKTSGWNGGYGLYVVIRHPNGVQTLYAHMSKVAVTVGQQVAQGELIGYVGSTGRSTGPHCHVEVRGARNPF